MNLELHQYIALGLILFLGSAIQSVAGFALAFVGIPLALWVGLTLPQAITMINLAALIQALIGARSLKTDIPWSLAKKALIIRILAAPLGTYLLTLLSTLSLDFLKQFLGFVLVLIMTIQNRLKIKPTENVPAAWGTFAFLMSGLMAGSLGMGGPALVLWVVAHTWSSSKSRGFLFVNYAGFLPFQFVYLVSAFGQPIVDTIYIGLLFSPLIFLGTILGLWVSKFISKDRLSKIIYFLLYAIALVSIIAPFMSRK